jgi:acyl-CoA reductase-like NAD-dependent aldehyde dehydrogenase
MYDNLLANVPTDLWIGGKWRKSSDGSRFDVIDPASENKVASVASATIEDANAALDAASAAFPAWAANKPRELLTGGRAPSGPGFFYPATVLSNVSDDAKMLNEEIFGPVASLHAFKSEEEVIKRQRHQIRLGRLSLHQGFESGTACL